jgi:murein DD-endopeptidase MepM/ murein hydrolase activator NlpD
MRGVSRLRAPILAAVALGLSSAPASSQTGYKYRDDKGQWVFTDQAPMSGTSEPLKFSHETRELKIGVVRTDEADVTQLVAVNECLCTATFHLVVARTGEAADSPGGQVVEQTLAPSTRRTLVRFAHPSDLQYAWKAAIGSPDAVHQPERPYRVPFAVGSTYLVSQAYPSRITHTTADTEYAVDLAPPDGTPVYAAREGMAINARHDSFRGAIAPSMLDQANVVAILHSDGTIGVYGHLHWDSIRVRIGEHVARGQYIADSGNTGFSSGPHLHFAVIRNSGGTDVSVPIQFAGLADVAAAPVDRMPLTAY